MCCLGLLPEDDLQLLIPLPSPGSGDSSYLEPGLADSCQLASAAPSNDSNSPTKKKPRWQGSKPDPVPLRSLLSGLSQRHCWTGMERKDRESQKDSGNSGNSGEEVRRQRKETWKWIKNSYAGDCLCDESWSLPPYRRNHVCFCSLLYPQHPAVPDTEDIFLHT